MRSFWGSWHLMTRFNRNSFGTRKFGHFGNCISYRLNFQRFGLSVSPKVPSVLEKTLQRKTAGSAGWHSPACLPPVEQRNFAEWTQAEAACKIRQSALQPVGHLLIENSPVRHNLSEIGNNVNLWTPRNRTEQRHTEATFVWTLLKSCSVFWTLHFISSLERSFSHFSHRLCIQTGQLNDFIQCYRDLPSIVHFMTLNKETSRFF